jgi:hypothetical protein
MFTTTGATSNATGFTVTVPTSDAGDRHCMDIDGQYSEWYAPVRGVSKTQRGPRPFVLGDGQSARPAS